LDTKRKTVPANQARHTKHTYHIHYMQATGINRFAGKSKSKKVDRTAHGYLILVSGDAEPEIFDVLAYPMTQCLLIKTLLSEAEPKSHFAVGNEICPEVLKGRRVIELPNVRANILSRVIEFCKYHEMQPFHEVKKPFQDGDVFENLVSEFDYNFIDQRHEIIFELTMAANYLDLKALFDLCMAKIAWMAKTVPPQELSNTLGFDYDFSPLQVDICSQENSYLESIGKVDEFVELLEKSGRQELLATEKEHAEEGARKVVLKYHELKLPEERLREAANKAAHAKFLKARELQQNMQLLGED
jgi:S-phase kinase-associated protein 1